MFSTLDFTNKKEIKEEERREKGFVTNSKTLGLSDKIIILLDEHNDKELEQFNATKSQISS